MFVQNQLSMLVPRRSTSCHGGNEVFTPEMKYVSFLTMNEQGWVRQDFCEKCWEKEKGKEASGIVWRGAVPKKLQKKLTPDQKAVELFLELVESKASGHEKELYVLALYLERKKELLGRGSLKNKSCFERLETGEVFAVEKIHMPPKEIDLIVKELLAKL